MTHSFSPKRFISIILSLLSCLLFSVPAFAAPDNMTNVGASGFTYSKTTLNNNTCNPVSNPKDIYICSNKDKCRQPQKDKVDMYVAAMQRTDKGLVLSFMVLNGKSYDLILRNLNNLVIFEDGDTDTVYVKNRYMNLDNQGCVIPAENRGIVQITVPASAYDHTACLSKATPGLSAMLHWV